MASTSPPRSSDPITPSDIGNPDLIAVIRAEIDAAGGRIPFARFMELALYHPAWGYYLSPERRPGRPGDFLTAPETHPFFGITLARQIAECWERLDRPDPFVVREYGSGIGALAWDVIAGLSKEAPECRAALQYRLVETNPHRLAQSLAAFAEGGLGDVVRGEEIPPGADPEPITGVVIANEVADAFPVHRLIWRDGRLREGWVVWSGDGFAEEEGELSRRRPQPIPKRCCGRTASPSTREIASRSARPRRRGLHRRRAGCGVATPSSSTTATRRPSSTGRTAWRAPSARIAVTP